ncbi:hypothetical protein TUM12370_33090 [Salmonella enterica subsp. enterica serovar Choleraesuis]|nr:hypothetical protein TUM12370_33090 [Salmonella enterica subsp. enterica serovar Choleraesuis]
MIMTTEYAALITRHLSGIQALRESLSRERAVTLIEFAEYDFLKEALYVLNIGWNEIDALKSNRDVLEHIYLTFSYLHDWENPLDNNTEENFQKRMRNGEEQYVNFRVRNANLLVAAYALSPWPFPANHLVLLQSHYEKSVTSIPVPLSWAGTRLFRAGCYGYVQYHIESLARAIHSVSCSASSKIHSVPARPNIDRASKTSSKVTPLRPLSVPDPIAIPKENNQNNKKQTSPNAATNLHKLAVGSVGALGVLSGALLASDLFLLGGISILLTAGGVCYVNAQQK